MDASENIAEKTYRAIGRFMFEFSQVEYTIRDYETEKKSCRGRKGTTTQLFLGELPAYLRDDEWRNRRQHQENERNVRLTKLRNRFREIRVVRDRVAHGLWVPFGDGGIVHYVSRSNPSSSRFANQANDLENMADELCELRAGLDRALTAVLFHL